MIIVPDRHPRVHRGAQDREDGQPLVGHRRAASSTTCRVPVANTIGEVGRGFQQQMAQFQDERLIGCYMAVAGCAGRCDRTVEYLQVREAFGKPLMANQYLQYRLAELVAEVDMLQRVLPHAPPSVRRRRGRHAAWRRSPSSRPAGSAREVADACRAVPRRHGLRRGDLDRALLPRLPADVHRRRRRRGHAAGDRRCSRGWGARVTDRPAGAGTQVVGRRRHDHAEPAGGAQRAQRRAHGRCWPSTPDAAGGRPAVRGRRAHRLGQHVLLRRRPARGAAVGRRRRSPAPGRG